MATGIPPISPKLQKGSIITVDQGQNNQRTEIPFQYNPETLTRRLTTQTASGQYDRSEAFRIKRPPEETFSLEIEIDATDQLEAAEQNTQQYGIHPRLAQLELLVYPQSQRVSDNDQLARQGVLEIVSLEVPLTLLSLGPNRVVPVRLTSFSITEEEFDPNLNPIRAKISLEMTALTYDDLGLDTQGGKAFMTYHKQKEKMAKKLPKKSGR
jgi:hypothetical protein